jgi:flagellin-like protein
MSERATTPVVGTVVLVGVVVVLAATASVTFGTVVEEARDTNEKPIPVSDDLLADGGFESGSPAASAWREYDAPLPPWAFGATGDDVSEGDEALVVDASRRSNEVFFNQSVADSVEPGRLYRLCADAKVDPAGSARFYVGVQYYDAGGDIVERATYEVTATDYRERCVLTDFRDGRPVASADVWAYATTGGGTAYVDDVSLREVQYLADPDEDTDDRPA